MDYTDTLPSPKWNINDIGSSIIDETTLFIGCITYEDRCTTAVERVVNFLIKQKTILGFIEIEDDECTYQPWKERCKRKTEKNWLKLNSILGSVGVTLPEDHKLEFRMSRRSEHFLQLLEQINNLKNKVKSATGNVRCVLDASCLPSYFALRLLKALIDDVSITELTIVYTKPGTYTKGELKFTPPDKTKADFLPFFGRVDGKVKWIVAVGFDFDSYKNADKILSETLNIDEVHTILPFPGYRPDYLIRTMTQNKELIDNSDQIYYSPADNPFRTYKLIKSIVGQSRNCILSTLSQTYWAGHRSRSNNIGCSNHTHSS